MSDLDPSNYSKPEQVRAQKAIDTILQATIELISIDKAEEITTRALTAKSGYSTGTLYRYFKKLDDILVFLFVRKRKMMLDELANRINNYPPEKDVQEFFNSLILPIIDVWKITISQKLYSRIFRNYLKRSANPEMFQMVSDVLIKPIYQVQRRDKTGTFDLLNEDEIGLKIRCLLTAFNSPMFENNAIAGTQRHKELITKIGIELFKKK